MKRGEPLKRGGPPRRLARLRAVNPRRRAARFLEDFGGAERVAFVQAMRCCACKHPPPSECSHVKSRGAGGKAADIVPMCRGCHAAFHSEGAAPFEARRRIDPGRLAFEAAVVEAGWLMSEPEGRISVAKIHLAGDKTKKGVRLAACGRASKNWTLDPRDVSCPECRAILAYAKRTIEGMAVRT